ncbi:MAG: hypothetical protein ACKOFB_00445 [bacterium]
MRLTFNDSVKELAPIFVALAKDIPYPANKFLDLEVSEVQIQRQILYHFVHEEPATSPFFELFARFVEMTFEKDPGNWLNDGYGGLDDVLNDCYMSFLTFTEVECMILEKLHEWKAKN